MTLEGPVRVDMELGSEDGVTLRLGKRF